MSVVEIIKHYQRSLEKCAGNLERMLHCVTKLYHLPITVQHLQDTGVGRTINGLRKYDGDCGEAAKACVAKWKAMVAAEESSDPEIEEQQIPEETEPISTKKHRDEYSPTRKHMEEKISNIESKERSRSKRKEEELCEKLKDDRSNGGYKKHREEKLNSSRSREESSNKSSSSQKNRDNVGNDKKHRDRTAQSSSSEDKSTINSGSDVDYNKKSIEEYECVKHKERTAHTSSKPVPKEPERKSQKPVSSSASTSKSRDSESSHKKHREDDKKSSSKKSIPEEKYKEKKREEHLADKNKKRSRPQPSASEDSGAEELFLSFDRPIKQEKVDKDHAKTKHPKVDSSRSSSSDNKHRKAEKRKEVVKKCSTATGIKTEDGSIDSLSGASFAEALGMVNPMRRSSPSSSSTFSSPKKSRSPSNHRSASPKRSSSGSSSKKPAVAMSNSPVEFDFLSSPSLKLEPADMDLPAINPNYRPLPGGYNPFDSPPQKKNKGLLSEEEALTQVMYHKNERTKVYSGVKLATFRRGDPPSLFEMCTRVLQDNIDSLGYTGGVPFDILAPVLKRASPDQLFELEYHNPYLIEDTDKLWEFHCSKQFRSMARQEMETYRELYMRGLDERAAKFEALKSNIKHAQATSVPLRKAKLTYMDSVAKPPREVARQQARNGTARPAPKGAPCRSVSTAPPRPVSTAKVKPRVAPLMQKTMKFARTFKR